MEPNRPKLSLNLADSSEALEALTQAIEHRSCVRAVYNRGQILVAPHILYERHGQPHMDGMVLARDGAAPPEAKLGTFKLSGLSKIVGTNDPVQVFRGFSATDPRYAEKVLAVIRE